MFITQSHITIGDYLFDFVHDVEVESSWQNQTSTAKIQLPAALRIDKNKLKETFPKGTEVVIKIGYKDSLNTVFEGFISRIHTTTPVMIECEDLMWKLKQIQVNENAKNESMQTYLSRVLNMEVDCFDVHLQKFIANKITGAQLLNQIKSDYGFPAFFRGGKLVVGKQYAAAGYKNHVVTFDNARNSNVASNSLEFMSKDDVKIKVTAISNLPSGEKHEVELGDPDGGSKTLNFFDISESDLKAIAEKEMERLQYDGYRGDLTLFMEPFVQHGDVITLQNDQENDKTGSYWIDGVTYKFGLSGGRQAVKLGSRT